MATSDQILSKLFNFKTTFSARGITFHMRIVSDSVVDDARMFALLEARKMRRLLRDPDSKEYLIHLDPIKDFTDDELINLVTVSASREVLREYITQTPRPILDPLPDNPTQEQQEEYEAAKEDREKQYFDDLEAYVEDWRARFTKTLVDKGRDHIEFLARRYQTDMVCEQRFSTDFEEYITWSSLYTDEKFKTRLFDSLESFKELPADLRLELREKYNQLTVGADDIKK